MLSCKDNESSATGDEAVKLSYEYKDSVINCKEVPYYGFTDAEEFIDYDDIENIVNSYRTAKDNRHFVIKDYKEGVCIVRYQGDDENVVIPETLDGKPVIKISGHYGNNKDIENNEGNYHSPFGDYLADNVKKVCLPSCLKEISSVTFRCFAGCVYGIQEIEVDKNNLYYTSLDGVLYSKDKSVLLCVPPRHKRKNLNIQEGTKTAYSPYSNKTVTLNIPESLKYIRDDVDYVNKFHDLSLKSINVDSDNRFFTSEDGILYNKNKTELVVYPFGKSDKKYKLPSTVKKVAKMYVNPSANLREISFDKNIKEINLVFDEEYSVDAKLKTVRGYKNTAAEDWAKENNLKFAALD